MLFFSSNYRSFPYTIKQKRNTQKNSITSLYAEPGKGRRISPEGFKLKINIQVPPGKQKIEILKKTLKYVKSDVRSTKYKQKSRCWWCVEIPSSLKIGEILTIIDYTGSYGGKRNRHAQREVKAISGGAKSKMVDGYGLAQYFIVLSDERYCWKSLHLSHEVTNKIGISI